MLCYNIVNVTELCLFCLVQFGYYEYVEVTIKCFLSPDNNKFLVDRYKTYLSNLFLGHKLDYNEANFVAERLLKKKLLNKKQYTYFINILNKNIGNK